LNEGKLKENLILNFQSLDSTKNIFMNLNSK